MIVNLAPYICELLYDFECVIIPGFGGFITKYQGAELNEVTNVISPPKKAIIFNKNLIGNDGLLAYQIGKTDGVSYNQAKEFILNEVLRWKEMLSAHQIVHISGVGNLSLAEEPGEEKKIQFEASETNFLPKAFGFSSIVALPAPTPIPIQTGIVEEPKNRAIQDRKLEQRSQRASIPVAAEEEKKQNSRKKLWLAAAVVPFLFYAAWIPLKTDLFDRGEIHPSDLNLFSYSKKGTYQPRTKKYAFAKSGFLVPAPLDTTRKYATVIMDDAEVRLTVKTQASQEIFVPESTSVSNEKLVAIKSSKKYFVIGGCFSKRSNAISFLEKYEAIGYNTQLADIHNGLYRVAFGNFSSRKKATKLLIDLRKDHNLSAWVLKK